MHGFVKVVASFFFLLLFFVFLIIGTLRFEILNQGFVLGSLQRNGVYALLPEKLAKALPNDPNLPREEKGDYAKIVSAISPQKLQKVIEQNLGSVFNFLNGSSQDINISLSGSDLGISGAGNIKWSLTKNMPKGSLDRIQIFSGLGSKLLLALIVITVLMFLLLLVADRGVLLVAGVLTLLLGGVGKIYLSIITANTPMKEPAQVLLVLASSSIFADIALSWLIFGVVLILVWFLLKKKNLLV